jgi:probable HAF family extracellular repeat protein
VQNAMMRCHLFAAGMLVGLIAEAATSPTFESSVAPLPPELSITDTSFYDPFGTEIIHAGPTFLWRGSSVQLKNGGPDKVNGKGDGFANRMPWFPPGWPFFAAYITIDGIEHEVQRDNDASTLADAINSKSEVVGGSGLKGFLREAFLWSNGTVKYLGDFINGPNPIVPESGEAISEEGVIYGTRHLGSSVGTGFITLVPNGAGRYNASEMTGFPTAELRISRKGHVASRSTFWDGSKMTAMGDLGVPKGVYPQSINARGHVVGRAISPGDLADHAFFWNGKGMYDLNNIVVLPPGWTMIIASEINDYGQIAADAYGDGRHQALRLTPPPEIAGIERNASSQLTLSFYPGSVESVRVEASNDFVQWNEVATQQAPASLSTTSISTTRNHQFFRIVRIR